MNYFLLFDKFVLIIAIFKTKKGYLVFCVSFFEHICSQSSSTKKLNPHSQNSLL